MGFHIEDTAAVPIISGYIEIMKGYIPDKWKRLMPLVAIGIGIFYAFSVKPGQVKDVVQTLMLGAMLGLTATGLHSGTKNGIQFLKKKEERVDSIDTGRGE